MANETELFILILVIVLTLIMHLILSHWGPRPGSRAK